ncbi:MAG: hypothetical protein N2201_06895 [candidate division WOR-3 bacterium]|nr:hypothetical protein [candidate division WOR-3 bacterium]
MKKIALIILVAIFFILYLIQHRQSIIYTQEISQLETELEMRKDEVLKLEGEKNRIFLFANLEKTAVKLGLTYPRPNTTNNNEKNQISAGKMPSNPTVKDD